MTDPTQEQLDEARNAGFRNQLQISGANEDTITDLSERYGPLHAERQEKYDGLSNAISEIASSSEQE